MSLEFTKITSLGILVMCVRNYKTCARIANIDTTKLGTDDAADLIELMIKAYHRVKKHTNYQVQNLLSM